jgi:hypothetical protein
MDIVNRYMNIDENPKSVIFMIMTMVMLFLGLILIALGVLESV